MDAVAANFVDTGSCGTGMDIEPEFPRLGFRERSGKARFASRTVLATEANLFLLFPCSPGCLNLVARFLGFLCHC